MTTAAPSWSPSEQHDRRPLRDLDFDAARVEQILTIGKIMRRRRVVNDLELRRPTLEKDESSPGRRGAREAVGVRP
jgi:hypothetical protein